MWRCVDLALTDVSDERIASIFRQPPAHAGSSLADFSTLKTETISSSETSVNARSTQGHIPESPLWKPQIVNNNKKIGTLTQTDVFYLSLHNMFRPIYAIIRWFLGKEKNGDGLHINYSDSMKHFLCYFKLVEYDITHILLQILKIRNY
jgi:hypothetical protein